MFSNIGVAEILIIAALSVVPAVVAIIIVLARKSSGRDHQSAPGAPPAGWFSDPTGRHAQRYWDGLRWSSKVADQGVISDDPLGADVRWPT
jgi:hypothetical protein